MPLPKVLGVGLPEGAEVESRMLSMPTVVPNLRIPANNVSPKTLPPMRLLQDDLDVTRLLSKLIEASPMTVKQIADTIGVTPQTIYGAKKGKSKCSLQWFLRLCNVTGARLYISLPKA